MAGRYRVAGQSVVVPDLTGGAADLVQGAHPVVKLILIVMVIFAGLSLYGRWTGQYVGTIDLLGPNVFGSGIVRAEHPRTNTQVRASQAGAYLAHSTAPGAL